MNLQETARNYVDCFLVAQDEFQGRADLILEEDFIQIKVGHYWLKRC